MRYLFKAFTQKHLNLQFRTAGGLRVQIVEFPGRWMQQNALNSLQDALRSVAGKTLPSGELQYGVFSSDAEALQRSIITLIYDRNNQPLAFNALAVIETEIQRHPMKVLHLGLVMIDPGQRSKGLSWILYGLTCFLLLLRNGMRPIYISNVTQVPSVFGLVSETFSNVYPTPTTTENSDFTRLLLARAIMEDHRDVFGVGSEAEFDEQRFVIANAYTGGSDYLKKTYRDAPKHRLDMYNEFCQLSLNYNRGDDLLQIGEINLSAAVRYVRKQVPKGSLLSLIALSSLLVLRRSILPVIHWFDSRVEHGCLRAAK